MERFYTKPRSLLVFVIILIGYFLATSCHKPQNYHLLAAEASTNNVTALTQLQQAAKGNNAKAQYELGKLYASGKGVPEDTAAAKKWFHRAAQNGNADAEFMMGIASYAPFGKKDNTAALVWFGKAARQGHIKAQLMLSKLYFSGQGVGQDYAKAIKWLRRAAAQGDAKAEMSMSIMYLTGENGLRQSDAKAVYWCRKAAAQLFTKNQCNIDKLRLEITNGRAKARRVRAKSDIQSIASALTLYRLDNHRYPTTQQGLSALVEKPSTPPLATDWHQYLSQMLKDP